MFAVNKIDAVSDAGAAYAAVRAALETFAQRAGLSPVGIVPVSALRGDNVISPAPVGGYDGPTLLALLESLPVPIPAAEAPWRLPVQWVARSGDGTGHQSRVYWGRLATGTVRVGDAVTVFPSGETARVTDIRHHAGAAIAVGEAGQSIGLVLDRALDISRGDWLGAPSALQGQRRFHATAAWLDTDPTAIGRRYWLRHGHRWVQGRIAAIEHRLDIDTLEPVDAAQLGVNDLGRVVVEVAEPLPLSPFGDSVQTGALIVVDPATHRTSGALLVD